MSRQNLTSKYKTNISMVLRSLAGAASTCWVHPETNEPGTGNLVFDPDQANRAVETALQSINDIIKRELIKVMNSEAFD